MKQRLTPAFLRPIQQPVQRRCGKGLPCTYPQCDCIAALPSMLRQQRLCRIALRKITVEIGQRYAREATPGSER